MLKAHGFSKASNQHVLEIFTDIAIRYIDLLIKTIKKFIDVREGYFINIKDISQAFLELKVILPNKQLDKYDISDITETGVENFENWFNSDINTRMREVARPTREFLEERKKDKKNLQKNVSSKMDNLTKALNEQSKQAQLQNPTMPYLPPPSVSSNRHTPVSTPYNMYQGGIQPFSQINSIQSQQQNNQKKIDDIDKDEENDYDIPSNATDEDWVQYLIRDQIATYMLNNHQHKNLQGQPQASNNVTNNVNTTNSTVNNNVELLRLKPTMFKDTVLFDYIPKDLRPLVDENSKGSTDFLIAGPMPEKLLHAFPYYKSDDDDSDYNTGDDDNSSEENDDNNDDDVNSSREDGDGHQQGGLAAFDYYEHHNLYQDDDVDIDLYGTGSSGNGLNLYG